MSQTSAPDQRLLVALLSLFGIAEDQEGQGQIGKGGGAHIERGDRCERMMCSRSVDVQHPLEMLASRMKLAEVIQAKRHGAVADQFARGVAQLLAETQQIQSGLTHRREIAARLLVGAEAAEDRDQGRRVAELLA